MPSSCIYSPLHSLIRCIYSFHLSYYHFDRSFISFIIIRYVPSSLPSIIMLIESPFTLRHWCLQQELPYARQYYTLGKSDNLHTIVVTVFALPEGRGIWIEG